MPYAGRNPPADAAPSKGAHDTCRSRGQGSCPPPAVDSTGVPPFLAACGSCPMPGGTLRPAASAWRGSQTAPSEPPRVDVMNHSWVVPYAGRNPPADSAPTKGAQITCLWTAQVFLPSLQLVGGSLCRAEPSHACGSCPMPGGTLHDLCGARASGEATSDGSTGCTLKSCQQPNVGGFRPA